MADENAENGEQHPYVLDVNKHARYFQMVLNGIPSKSQDMQRALIAFFCLCGLDLLGQLERIAKIRPQIVAWLKHTQKHNEDCCFRGGSCFTHESNDLDTPHVTMTSLSLLSLLMLDEPIDHDDELKLEKVAQSLGRFQIDNGCFQATLLENDEFDVRFIYSAACIYAILKMVDQRRQVGSSLLLPNCMLNVEKMVNFLDSLFTYENAFTLKPDLETHAGSVYCALAALKLTDCLEKVVNADRREALIKWLLRRQNEDGGFNGRPNKPSDSCYFFWVGASLSLLNATHLVDPKSVIAFSRETEDLCIGGFGKLPGCPADPLHAYLTLAGLSLFGAHRDVLGKVNPALCCPDRCISEFLKEQQ